MSPIRTKGRVEIQALSGRLIVTISPRPHWILLAAEAAIAGVFFLFASRGWSGYTLFIRIVIGWAAATTIFGLLYQLTGSETIEIDSRQFAIRKEALGWTRNKEFPIERCEQLALHEHSEDDASALEVKVGWQTIRFADHISEDDVMEILAALQRELPDVASRLLSIPHEKSGFTILKLT